MVAGRDADQPFSVCQGVVLFVCSDKFADVAFPVAAEVGVVAAEQVVIVAWAELKQEVHVEAAGERFVRFAPFRNHDRIGVARIQESADILPELDRLALAGVVLDKGARHIHPETVAAFVKPESP